MAKKITFIILLVLFGLVGTAKADRKKYDKLSEAKYSPACLTDLNPQFENSDDNAAQSRVIVGKDNDCELGVNQSVGGADYSLLAEAGADHDRDGANKFRSFTGHAAATIKAGETALMLGLASEYATLMGAFGTHWVWNTSGDPTRVYDLASNYAQLKPLVGIKLNAGNKVGIRLMGGPSAMWDRKVRFNGGWADWKVNAFSGVVEFRLEGTYEAFAKYVDNYGHRASVLVGVPGKKGSKIAEIMKIGVAGEMIASKEKGHNVASYPGLFLVLELSFLKPSASFVSNIGSSNASQIVGSFGIVGEAGAGSKPPQNLTKGE